MPRLLVLLAAQLALLPALSTAFAEEAKVRLLVGSVADGRISAGLAIDLPEGWKTYWRTPGDAGIPPSLDASASTGLGPVEVRFPAPERFDEAGLTAIGYTRSVVLPIATRLADPNRAGELDLSVMIGLCHEICVPFETRIRANIAPQGLRNATAAAEIAAAEARVPRPVDATTTAPVVAVKREAGPNGPRLVAEVTPGPARGERDVFVEGPSTDWSLPQPVRIDAPGATERWAFDLDGLPKDADLAAIDLRFTIRTGERAVEQIVRVDARPPTP